MNKRIYWGLAILIILLCTAFVSITIRNFAETRQLERELAAVKQFEENATQQVTFGNRPPPPGKTFEKGGHWHGDEWHDAPHAAIVPSEPVIPTYKGPLTYHAELLETNPAEALRLQSKQMNHWSLPHIPDLDPDDQLANDYARVEYLLRYIKVTGEVPAGVNRNRLGESFDELHREMIRLVDAGGFWNDPNHRVNKLKKLTWVGMEPPTSWSEQGSPRWD